MPCGLIQYCHRLPDPVPRPQSFQEWRAGLKYHLAKNNIPVEDRPDGTLVAKFGTEKKIMAPAMQHENYTRYLDKLAGKEVAVNV